MAQLLSADGLAQKVQQPFSFAITTQTEGERAPVTTVLSAHSEQECIRWTKALIAAIAAAGGAKTNIAEVSGVRSSVRRTDPRDISQHSSFRASSTQQFSRQSSHHAMQRQSSRYSTMSREVNARNRAVSSLDQMTSLEEEDLLKLREKQLRQLAEHVDIVYDFKGYNHKRDKEVVVELILARTGKGADSHFRQSHAHF